MQKTHSIIVHPSCWFLLSGFYGFYVHMCTQQCGHLAEAPAPCLHVVLAVPSVAQSTCAALCSNNSTVCWAAVALWLLPDPLWPFFVLQHHSLWPIWFSPKDLTSFSSQECSECLPLNDCRNVHNTGSPASEPDCSRASGKENDTLPLFRLCSPGTCTKRGKSQMNEKHKMKLKKRKHHLP